MTVPDSWTLDALIEAFEQHQRRTRGLRDTTLHGYAPLVRGLIREALGDDPIDVRRLSPSDVIRFVFTMTSRFSPRSMKTVGTALRSFFRFLTRKVSVTSGSRPRSPPWPTGAFPRSLGVSTMSNSPECSPRLVAPPRAF